MAIDAEGGRVDRLKEIVGPAPSAALLARQPASSSLQAGHWVAQSLRLFDIDVDFAPVVDLDRGLAGNALDERYFGATPAGGHPARPGLPARPPLRRAPGGCIKHFPGLGAAGEDTHFQMSAVYLPAEELRPDLEPFAALARLAGAVMVGHALYPAYDSSMRPATLSPTILGGILRGRLGFDGLAFSDDMEMKALDEWGDLPERCEIAFAAGCDVLLVCHTLEALPAIVERLSHPTLEARVAEANRRLDTYRQRLITLRSAREYVDFMRNNSQGEQLERVRQTLAQIQASKG